MRTILAVGYLNRENSIMQVNVNAINRQTSRGDEPITTAVLCPSCGKLAEVRIIQGVVALWPDPEIQILHPNCEHDALKHELDLAASITRAALED